MLPLTLPPIVYGWGVLAACLAVTLAWTYYVFR